MANRAQRLMTTLGNNIKRHEDDGTVSQLGAPPNGPLRKRQTQIQNQEQRVKGDKKVYECKACHYQGISENAMICPECGVKQIKEDWSDRVKKTRKTLVEGKDSWIDEAVSVFMAILEFADPCPVSISEDGTAHKELSGRVTEALLDFVKWQESHYQLASNGENNE